MRLQAEGALHPCEKRISRKCARAWTRGPCPEGPGDLSPLPPPVGRVKTERSDSKRFNFATSWTRSALGAIEGEVDFMSGLSLFNSEILSTKGTRGTRSRAGWRF